VSTAIERIRRKLESKNFKKRYAQIIETI